MTPTDLKQTSSSKQILIAPLDVNCDELDQQQLTQQNQDSTVETASMDISAAHLILNYLERHLNERERLARQWSDLSTKHARANPPANVRKFARFALSSANAIKNRSIDSIPFDKNRVKLNTNNSQQQSNYINASLLYDDEPSSPTHIVAQAPLESTVLQFWQVS